MSVVDSAFSSVGERAFSPLLKLVTTTDIFQHLFHRFQYSPFIKATKKVTLNTIWIRCVSHHSLEVQFYVLLPRKNLPKSELGKISYKTFCSTRFFYISNTFICNARLKLAKNQANAEQHPEPELLLFENYSHSSPTLSSKKNRTYSKK